MHKIVVWVQTVLLPVLGAPGMFVVAFCDSSFLSLPEINDLLVVTSSAAHPTRMALYVVMTTLGSVAGCFVLYFLGRRGGEAFLERRFGREQVGRSRALFRRWDVLALAIPAVLPPPMPFKIFVLSAGVFGLPARRFALTVAIARGLRYSFWGVLGVFYGDAGLAMLKGVDAWSTRNAPVLLSLLVAAGVAALAVYLRYRRRRRDALCYDDVGDK